MRRRVLVLVSVLVLAGPACGADEDPTVDVPTGGASTTTSSARDGAPTTEPGDESATIDDAGDDLDAFEASAVQHVSQERGLLTAIRHAAHDGYYRVVFEFRDGLPGTKIGFTERPIIQDGSGDEIDVAGDQVLLAQFEPASGVDLQGENAVETYTGPKRLEVEQAPVVELVRVSDFEAHLDWAIGVEEASRFRLTPLQNPPRIVIDIQSG